MYALIEYKPPPGPWNKGKIMGPKPPLWPQEVWSIRIHLQMKAKGRDMAMFNLAIDSKLRWFCSGTRAWKAPFTILE